MSEKNKLEWDKALLYAYNRDDESPCDESQNYAIEHKGKLYPNKIIYRLLLNF